MKRALFLVCCPAILLSLTAWSLQAAPPPELPSSLLDWQAYAEPPAGQVCRGFYLSPELELPESHLPFGSARLFAESAEIRYSPEGGLSLQGDVRLRRGTIYLTADEAEVSADQNEVQLSGDLAVRQDGLLLRADDGYYRLDQRFIQLQRAHYVLHEQRLRGSAWRLEQQPDGRVLLNDAALTSCAPGDQAWRLVAGKLELNRESGFGDAWHVRMEVHRVPVFYWPWLRFPIDDRRHTGLLSPSLSYSRSNGLDYLQPIYWNLAPNHDATFYPRYIGDRGFMLGAEFRYLKPSDSGRLYYARLGDDERYGGLDRWHVEAEHQGHLGSRLSYRLDFGQVSDDRYFRDLGRDGLDTDDKNLLQQLRFDYRQGIWRSSLAWQGYQKLEPDQYTLPGDVNPGPQYDLLDLRSGRDARYQDYYYWPQLSLRGGDWLTERWRWNLETELTYFSKRFDAGLSPLDSWQSGIVAAPGGGHYINHWGSPDALRLYLQPGLQGDWRWPWAYVRPQAYLKYTHYDLDPYWDAAALPQDRSSVELQPSYTQPVFSLDTGLFLERDAQWFGTNLLQTLEPRVYAAYVPFVEQYEIPNLFDSSFLEPDINQFFRAERIGGRDRTGDLEKVALGLTQRLILPDSGRELARLTLAKEFYLSDRRIIDEATTLHPDDPGRSDNLPREQRPYQAVRNQSSLGLQGSWNITPDLALRSNLLWDDYFRKTESSSTLLSYQPGQGIELGLGHSYFSNFVTSSYLGPKPDRSLLDSHSYAERAEEQYYVSAVLPLNDYWRLFAKRSYDWKRDEKLDSITGVEYNSCCWQLQFVYRDWIRNPDTSPTQNNDGSFDNRDRDYGFFVQVLFKQLGGVGQGTRQLLRREIQGYTDRP